MRKNKGADQIMDMADLQKRAFGALYERSMDLPAFVENLVYIEDKDSEEQLVKFKLWHEQREALVTMRDNRKTMILKARQLGITWLVLAYASWLMLTRPGTTVVALSRTETEAKEMVRRIGVILDNCNISRREKWAGARHKVTIMNASVELNGIESRFNAFASSENTARSFTANLLILDEWAFQQADRAIWQSALPIVNRPTGGQVIGMSTIKLGSLFAELWMDEKCDFAKVFIPWTADPRRGEEWYQRTKASCVSEMQMLQEYPATPEEAFTAAQGRFFGELRGDIHIADGMPTGEMMRYASIDYGLDALAAIWYAVDTEGYAIAYREVYKSGLLASEAAEIMARENVDVIYAPGDLWNRHSDTGRSTAEIFALNGAPLVKASNNRRQGWQDVKEWLRPHERRKQDGETEITARLRFLRGSVPNLWRTMTAILTDERDPCDAARDPHELTHLPDSVRYFCAGRPMPADTGARYNDDDTASWDDIMNYGR